MTDPSHLTGAVHRWPTPRVAAKRNSRKSLVENQQWSAPALEQAVELAEGILPREFHDESELNSTALHYWPTPTQADGMGGPGSSGRDGGDNLRTAVAETLPTPTASRRTGLQSHGKNVVTGQLNPTWVEWLMGFPEGWTDLEPSATPSSPKSPNGSVND